MTDLTAPAKAAAPADIPTDHPHIVRTPGIRGGRPRIKGTGIDVRLIAGFHKMGETVEDILEMYPHLTPAGVHDAISYYYDHLEDIEAEIEENKIENLLEKHNAYVDDQGVVHFRDLEAE